MASVARRPGWRRPGETGSPAATGAPEWIGSETPIAYSEAVAAMEARVAAIHAGTAGELVWLLEHPALYTAGTSATPDELLDGGRLPVHRTGRGGRYTYHGPGQRVAYVMLDLGRRGRDLHAYVGGLEDWIVAALARLGVGAARRAGRVGVWVAAPGGGEAKIAAIGVRIRRWITYHGVSVNLSPDLGRYAGIVPCGLRGFGVTSLEALGVAASMDELDAALRDTFEAALPPLRPAGQPRPGHMPGSLASDR